MRKEIPGFWQGGAHFPVPVEGTWRDFVRSVNGSIVEDLIPQPRQFQNADFLFADDSVVAELKEIETEFSLSPSFEKGFDQLMQRLVEEQPDWRPTLFGGDGIYPDWFHREFIRIFRPPLSRILKKANSQIKETKAKFSISSPTGVLLLVNDGFTSISPFLIRALACDILSNSYSSIDALVYLTVNRHVEVASSDEPKLVWAPSYSSKASDDLVKFIDTLGAQWFDFLEKITGPFTSRTVTDDSTFFKNSKAIVHPDLPTFKG